MKTMYIRYDGWTPSVLGDAVSGQVNTLRCSFAFSADWDAYQNRKAIFETDEAKKEESLDENGSCLIPRVVLTKRGKLKISAYGTETGENGELLRYNGRPAEIIVDLGGNVDGESTDDPVYPQIGEAVLYTAQSLTEAQQAQARANIGAGTPYTLPEASSDALGGIKADAAETADTQPVRIGGDGKLYTAPGSGGADISLGISGATAGQMAKVKAVDASGVPTAWEAGDAASGGGTNGEKIVEIANGVDVSTVSSFSYSTDMDGNPLKANRFSIMLNAPNVTKDDAWVEMTVNGITVLRMYYYKNKKINLRTIIHPTYCEHILYLSENIGLNGAYVGRNESQYGVVRFVGAIDHDFTEAEKTIVLKYNHGINDPTWGDNAKLWMWGE